MSNWTHVAGIVRIDGFRMLDDDVPDFEEIFGKSIDYYGDWEDYHKHPEQYMPCGSEGSLQMSVWINPDKSHICSYTVSIFGDLRNHDSCDEIIEWFKSKLKNLWVRNAVITVENEWYGTKTYTYNYKDFEDELKGE